MRLIEEQERASPRINKRETHTPIGVPHCSGGETGGWCGNTMFTDPSRGARTFQVADGVALI